MKGLNRLPAAGIDLRVTVYHMVRIIIIAAILAFLVKATLIDTVRMSGSQMSPSIINGDRLLTLRTPYIPVFRRLFTPPYDKALVFRNAEGLNILRVAAASGDSLSLDSGTVFAQVPLPVINSFQLSKDDLVPEEYAPRDFFSTYHLPGKGTNLIINRLSLRDLFFTVDIIRQEHTDDTVTIKPYLLLDDSVHSNYELTDFMFYKGLLDSVPDTLKSNWFFWNRLEEYLYQKYSDRKVTLYFTVLLNNLEIEEYRVKDDYYFLIADNRRSGLDSRYTGPVRKSRCFGRVAMVLWSHGKSEDNKWHFRFNRMGRFIP